MKFWLKLLIFSSFFLLCGAGIYVYYLYSSVKTAVQQMYVPLHKEVSERRQERPSVPSNDPVSILVLGVDERPNDRGRSDTILFLAANPHTHSLQMVSIPRDAYTNIIQHGSMDKINHAFAFGGSDMAVKTVENFLGVPVNYYITVNMEAFLQIVDLLGGVDVINERAFLFEEDSFAKGPLHLNGTRALEYARMRHDDPKGDLGRNKRQQQIVAAILEKAKQPKTFYRLDGILQQLGTHVKTNLTFAEMKHLAQNYQPSLEKKETISIAGKGTMINGVYYYMVEEKERKRIASLLQKQLELPHGQSYSYLSLIHLSNARAFKTFTLARE